MAKRKHGKLNKQEYLALRAQGYTFTACAKALGCSVWTIYNERSRNAEFKALDDSIEDLDFVTNWKSWKNKAIADIDVKSISQTQLDLLKFIAPSKVTESTTADNGLYNFMENVYAAGESQGKRSGNQEFHGEVSGILGESDEADAVGDN